jgi:signal transduction histidine kinase
MIMAVIMIVSFTIFQRKMEQTENENIARIMALVNKEYPDVEPGDMARMLKKAYAEKTSDNAFVKISGNASEKNSGKTSIKSEDNILEKYGYEVDSSYWIKEEKTITAIFFGCMLGVVLVTAFSIQGIFLMYNKKKDREISDITRLIEAINNKNYSLEIDSLSEDELSILKNEIYKTTVFLKENADNSMRDKESLKKSLQDISHQLKTPLTSILINLDNVMKDPDMEPEVRLRFLRQIRRDTESMNFMIQTLLKLSKFETNTITFNKNNVKLAEVLDDAIDNVAVLSDLRNVDIQKNIKGDIELYCDRSWMCEALKNIVKNAVEHSPEGSSVLISASKNKLYTEISVMDHGTGISEKDISHIFERFYKDQDASNDSIGIGLALSRDIIESQNGKIRVQSEPGSGTTFFIQIF